MRTLAGVRGGRAVVTALLLLAGGACATSSGGASARQLNAAQIMATLQSQDETFYEVLVRARPEWLVARTGAPAPVVFIDGIETGPLETLHTLLARHVQSAEYLLPAEAASRMGAGYEGGVIQVSRR